MSFPGTLVPAPVETPALYGLFSAARLMALNGHEQLGIVYDTVCDRVPRVWPGACRSLAPIPPVNRSLTATLTGKRRDGASGPYQVTAAVTVDGGPVRTMAAVVNGYNGGTVVTGQAARVVFETDTAGARNVDLIDVLTGDVHTLTVTQAADGTLGTGNTATYTVVDQLSEVKLGGAPPIITEAGAFAVYAVEQCFMGRSMEEQTERARRRLEAIEQPSVERAVWTGEYGNRPALATSDPEILGGSATTAVPVKTGVSLLEKWLGETSSYSGYLHAYRGLAALLPLVIERNGNRLETKLGNTWVFGGGYPTSGPASQPLPADGEAWIFATRQPTVRRSEVLIPAETASGAFKWDTNETFIVAERIYVFDFPCNTAAVKVDLSLAGAP